MAKVIAVAVRGFTSARFTSVESANEYIKGQNPAMQSVMEVVTFDEDKYARINADVRRLCKKSYDTPKKKGR